MPSSCKRPLHPPNPDARHRRLLEGIGFSPVFITGDHRSGTTFLYMLLQAANRFNVATAYHVLRYRELIDKQLAGRTEDAKQGLADEFRAAGVLDRIIDGVMVSPEMPEEYGFVLADPGAPNVRPDTLARFTELCRKLTLLGHPDRPLLLKNPWDFCSSLYLKQQFSNARFLYLQRDPARTVNSQVRAFRSMFQARNPYVAMLAPRYGRVFRRPLLLAPARALFSQRHGLAARMIAYRCARSIKEASRQRALLPSMDVFTVRYEDLCRSPNQALAGVFRWLGLDETGLPDFRTLVAPRGGPLMPEVERLRPKLTVRLRDYCTEFGYSTG